MNKHRFIATSILIATLVLMMSCDSNNEKSEKKEGGVIIGNITKGNQTAASLAISLDDATKLMEQHNRLTEDWFTYTYTRVWIEIIQIKGGKLNYYLGVEASMEGKNDERVYSCYSVYSELEINNTELSFYPDALQQSCRGKCCSSCKLVLLENNNIGCDCHISIDDPNCKGNAKCNHRESRMMDEEQEKNDMI